MSTSAGSVFKTACVTVLGSGFAPFASGTWGSAAAILILLVVTLIANAAGASYATHQIGIGVGVALACIASVAFGEWAVVRFGRKDPKQFVLDEFAGQWIALLCMPVMPGLSTACVAVVASQFVLFRALDVWKPTPGRQLEALPFGWGILCDDLSSGIYANILGQILWRIGPAAAWLEQQAA